MLSLKNIKKDYSAGDSVVHALKGIDLDFRKSEFVSILGPSGCGKTTMLNIIGGLDKYTEGDLIINSRSTKNYKDRDWDAYRNHSIGFVFQSYNLIPHQTVLQNVELALTLSGVGKAERRKKAVEALEKVGLGSQLKKRPGEMSGGQMQRVAIARAIVNDPDIILADEPTGALDTETSVQVMDILKEISKDRLVIMVTHNPELANKYSTRIIRMLDGVITDDTMPLSDEEKKALEPQSNTEKTKKIKQKKPSMSIFTAFGLSLKNLFTKKGRTILTAFAGSIGIIGIALIFSVSQGLSTYIDMVQEDTLSSYPLTIEGSHMDLGVLLETFISAAKSDTQHENDAVYSKSVVYNLINSLNNLEASENDLKAFKKFIESEKLKEESEFGLNEALSGVQYTYDLDMLIYTKSVDGSIIRSDSKELLMELITEHLGMDMSTMLGMSENSPMGSSSMMSMFSPAAAMNLWQEMLPGENGKYVSELLEKQYDVIHGSWPNAYNEVVLVVDQNNELDDMALYALGLKSKDEIDEIMKAAISGDDIKVESKKWTYDEICNMEFRTILNSNCYTLDETTGLYTDLRETDAGLKYLYDNGLTIKVVGIVKPNEDAVSAMLKGSIGYTSKLTEHIINEAKNSASIDAQLKNEKVDIFTGLPFKESTGSMTNEEKEQKLKEYIASLNDADKVQFSIKLHSTPTKEQINQFLIENVDKTPVDTMKQTLVAALTAQMGMNKDDVEEYISKMSDDEIKEIYVEIATEQFKMQYAMSVTQMLANVPPQQLIAQIDILLSQRTPEQIADLHDELLEFSESTYEENLKELGYIDLDKPSTINLFAASFESKDQIEAAIGKYNESVDEISKIKYTDYVGIMMSSITSILNAITYVLIAFVSISLIVSSIMIGVITLISVQERTKEIGILRAIGASKKNVSSMFNAETVIIGFISGLIGVGFTFLICIPINIIIQGLTGLTGLRAYLPISVAIGLIIISFLLTLFAGIIPSKSAAKKDPVVALRTE